jgi:hypothetical protein
VSFENSKTYQPAREKNKLEKITKFIQILGARKIDHSP